MTRDQRARLKELATDAVNTIFTDRNALDKEGAERLLAREEATTIGIVVAILNLAKVGIPQAFESALVEGLLGGGTDNYVVEILKELHLISANQEEAAKASMQSSGETSLLEELINTGVITKEQVAGALAGKFGMEFVTLTGPESEIPPEIIGLVPAHVARRYQVVPIKKTGNTIVVVLSNPMNVDTLDTLRHILKMNVESVVATDDDIKSALANYYPGEDPPATYTAV